MEYISLSRIWAVFGVLRSVWSAHFRDVSILGQGLQNSRYHSLTLSKWSENTSIRAPSERDSDRQEIFMTLEIRVMPQMVARALCEGKTTWQLQLLPRCLQSTTLLKSVFSDISHTLRQDPWPGVLKQHRTDSVFCVCMIFVLFWVLSYFLFIFVWLVVFCCGFFCLLYFLVCFDFHFFFREIKNMTLSVEGGERSGRSWVWGRISKMYEKF